MMNEQTREVNTSIGCGVVDCKYNRSGDYCTLRKSHVGNTCSCDAESCTCCDARFFRAVFLINRRHLIAFYKKW